MEASQQGPAQPEEQPGVDTRVSQERGLGGPSAFPGVVQGDRENVEVKAVESERDELASEEERHPAADQSPVATEADKAIVGDPGFHEQQPRVTEGGPQSANTPHATSAPPPSAQSGVPLAEDRAAGIEPGPKGPVVPVRTEGDAPDHDASEGQTATSPGGGA